MQNGVIWFWTDRSGDVGYHRSKSHLHSSRQEKRGEKEKGMSIILSFSTLWSIAVVLFCRIQRSINHSLLNIEQSIHMKAQ